MLDIVLVNVISCASIENKLHKFYDVVKPIESESSIEVLLYNTPKSQYNSTASNTGPATGNIERNVTPGRLVSHAQKENFFLGGGSCRRM